MSEKKAIADHLKNAAKDFQKVVDFGLRVSLELNGTPATKQTEWSSVVHTKMCVTGASIEHMLEARLKDHSVVIAMCRMIMEASVLFLYLQEPVTDDEWNCRLLCLRLHDTSNRIKLMRGFPGGSDADLRQGREQLTAELTANSFYKSLPKEQSERLLTGEHFYVRGVRNAVKNSSGWDVEKYMSLYSYFSSHAHSAPMSFFRVRQHKVSFSDPSEAQMAAVVTALGAAEYSLLKATLAYLATTPDKQTRFKDEELAEMGKALDIAKRHFEIVDPPEVERAR